MNLNFNLQTKFLVDRYNLYVLQKEFLALTLEHLRDIYNKYSLFKERIENILKIHNLIICKSKILLFYSVYIFAYNKYY